MSHIYKTKIMLSNNDTLYSTNDVNEILDFINTQPKFIFINTSVTGSIYNESTKLSYLNISHIVEFKELQK